MKWQRIISTILSGIMSITSIASGFTSYAVAGNAAKNAFESGEISVDAENSLGSLFSNEIGEQLEQQNDFSNSIISVEITEKTAFVNYNSATDCKVIVGIYDDSGEMLLGTGKADVQCEETTTTVEINIDTMPQFFYIKAYLVSGLAPVCEVYENPNYTSKMAEFFSKTTNDFDEERVLNFDEDITNNFAVYSEDVILLEEKEGYNNVITCDNENGVYVFEKADATLLSLSSGDILSYDYGDESEIIIVKVDTITVDGTTVTITAAETGLDEVFEYIRLEEQADQSEAQFDTEGIPDVIESDFSNLDHSNEYESSQENGTEPLNDTTLRLKKDKKFLSDENVDVKSKLELEIENGKAEVSKTDTVKIKFVSNEESTEDKGSNVKLKADIFSGTLLYTSTLSLKLYFSDSSKSDDFDANKDSGLINYFEIKWEQNLSISGKMSASVSKEFPLFKATYAIGYGFFITFEPKFIVGGDAELELNGYFTETLGFRVQNGVSTSISENPYFTPSVKVKGTFYVGLDIGPTIKWISKHLACVETEISGKAKITAESEVKLGEAGGNGKPKDKHECIDDVLTGLVEGCLDGRIDFIITIGGTGKILNNDKLKIELEAEFSFHFKDFYYSAVFDEFDWDKCPHKLYYYELTVIDIDENPIEGAEITLNAETIETDSEGKALLYFKTGDNDVSIKHDDYDYFSETYTVKITRKNKNSGDISAKHEVDDNDKVSNGGDLKYNFETAEVVKINGEENRSEEIKLRDKSYTVNVTVVDSEVNPVRNVNIASNCDDEYYTTEGKTGFNGTYKLRLPNGEWEITASTRGYIPASEIVTVEDADTEVTLTIVGNPCTFTVTDQYGDPVNGAKLLFTNTETGESVSSLDPTTDENGLYTYSFDVGEYVFTATKRGYDDYEGSFTVPEGGTEVKVEMYCDYKVVNVTAVDADGNPVEGVIISNNFNSTTYVTNSDGFTEVMLPVGNYSLEAKTDTIAGTASVSVPDSDEPKEVTITMETFASGTCGKTVYWTLTGSTLRIYGEGTMYNYDHSRFPWHHIEEDSIERIIIENGVTSIGDFAFSGCYPSTSITIPDSVSYIGDYAFSGTGVTSVTIPEGVTHIGECVFHSCANLTSITIPEGVTSIGNNAFCWCDSLTSVTIPDSVSYIGDYAFANCDLLTSVTIPGSVTNIGNNAFTNCDLLTLVTINDGVTSIGSEAFSNCEVLTSIAIPDSVTSIGESAFSGCTALTSITIPDSVTSIGYEAFYNSAIYNNKETEPIIYIDSWIVYCNRDVTYVNLKEGTRGIGDQAFRNCDEFTSITIPDSVTSIGDQAFRNCDEFTSITIPDSVTSIGDYAFYDCKNLESIKIPNSVTSIGDYAFKYCDALTSITIPDSVTTIGDYAFSDCDNLTSVTISDNVISIGYNSFVNTPWFEAKRKENPIVIVNGILIDATTCEGDVVIPDSVTSIGNYAFSNCGVTSITIPDSVTSIGNYAFDFCDLTSITIPDSVTSIGRCAFYNCRTLTTITIPDSVTSIGDEAFCGCFFLTSITIPDSVTSIGNLAFGYCGLTSITIPDSVTSIGDEAFYYCDSLTTITIPDSIISIGNEAFRECKSLTTITIPDSISYIGNMAFFECDALTDIYYTGTKKQWNEIVIKDATFDYTRLATIHYNYTPEKTATSPYSMRKTSAVKLLNVETMEATPITTSSTTSTATTTSDTITTATAKTVTFTNLDPDRVYNFYSMKSHEVEDILSTENLLHVSQGTADENGKLTFKYFPYTEEAVEFVVGMIYCIEYVDVSVEDMQFTGSELTAEITVTDGEKLLTEGADYTLSGTLSTAAIGVHEIKVSGIGDYYGDKYVHYTVTCQHEYTGGICKICGNQCTHIYENGICTVCGEVVSVTTTTTSTTTTTTTTTILSPTEYLLGDINEDGKVDARDASSILSLYADVSSGGRELTDKEKAICNVNSDANVDARDASIVLAYYADLQSGNNITLEEFMKKEY